MREADQLIDHAHGAAALWWSATPAVAGERVGLIGRWRADHAAAAADLLEIACARLRAAGCTLAIGPMDGCTWLSYRLTTWRGDRPRFALEPDTPDPWPAWWLAAGFAVDACYTSSEMPLLGDDPREALIVRRLDAAGVELRHLDPDDYEGELRRIHRVSLAAFAGNHLYTPLGEEDFLALYLPARALVLPGLCWLAERAGEPVGFAFAIPDIEQQRRGQAIDTLVFKTLAVLPGRACAGLGRLLTLRVHQGGAALGLSRAIHALMHEDNLSQKLGARATVIRRYTLYRRRLA